MPDPLPLVMVGAGLFTLLTSVAAVVAFLLGVYHGRRRARQPEPEGDVSFEEICHAAARAKEERRRMGNLNRDYVDGTDGVLAELVAEHELTPEQMDVAYRAGGEDVELEELS